MLRPQKTYNVTGHKTINLTQKIYYYDTPYHYLHGLYFLTNLVLDLTDPGIAFEEHFK